MDLIACKWKCEETPGCNYVNQGWEHAPTWCTYSGEDVAYRSFNLPLFGFIDGMHIPDVGMLLEECVHPLDASVRSQAICQVHVIYIDM